MHGNRKGKTLLAYGRLRKHKKDKQNKSEHVESHVNTEQKKKIKNNLFGYSNNLQAIYFLHIESIIGNFISFLKTTMLYFYTIYLVALVSSNTTRILSNRNTWTSY